MQKYEILNKIVHSNIRLKPDDGYYFSSASHFVSIVFHEFVKVSQCYPIVFIKSSDQKKFHPAALLSLEPGKNLFVDSTGAWRAGYYVPAAFRRYPFALTESESGEMAICIDTSSSHFNWEDGELLIDSMGASTPAMDKISGFLQELMNSEALAAEFSDCLNKFGLLSPCNFKIKGPDGEREYSGSYMVDEKKFLELSDEIFFELRQKGYLALIYAHLFSLAQIEKFGALHSAE